MSDKLRELHWLYEMRCDAVNEMDQSVCACGWVSKWQPRVGLAAVAWWEHAQAVLAESGAAPAVGQLSEEQVESCIVNTPAGDDYMTGVTERLNALLRSEAAKEPT